MYLSDAQQQQVMALSRNLEKRTGIEFLAAVVGKCDTYPEIPWKAFAFFSSLSALVVLAYLIVMPAPGPVLACLAWVLGAGAAGALLTPFWPAFARLFLDGERAVVEARQYAQGLFLEHGLCRTERQRAVLLLVGLFEHQVVILPGKGVQGGLDRENLTQIIDTMKPYLRRGDHYQALVESIAHLEEALVGAGFEGAVDDRNEVPDGLIQEKGDRR